MDNHRRRVAITGLGVVTSLGWEVEQFWQNLLKGKSGISKITRYDCTDDRCQIAGEIKDFDASPWISKPERRRWDLFTQYAFVAMDQAIKDSGIKMDDEDPTRCGIALGSGMGGMSTVEQQIHLAREHGVRRVNPYLIPAVMVSAPSAEISMKYNLQGPNFSASAACSSAGYAIGLATRMIQYGDADVMVTGGTEAIITSVAVAGFASARALSKRNDQPEKASRPFDKDRDGFVMGEGAGILILEDLEKAKQRNAHIYGEVCGVAWGADAHHITAPAPGGRGAIWVMQKALEDAKLDKEKISYINAHGTSTLQNDVIETLAIKSVFGDYAYKIPISSTKSMLGHLIGAAGALESVVCALSLKNNTIHATVNHEVPDPECDLDYVPEGAREKEINYTLSNSFAFGGANACLVFGKV